MPSPSTQPGGDLLVGFYFSLSFDNKPSSIDAAFQEASGISMELGTEDFQEGGQNIYAWKLPGAPKYSNLVLKRGWMLINSDLRKWCQQTMQGQYSKPIQPKEIQVALMNEKGQVIMRWNFHNAYPVKWDTSGFDSMKNEVLLETIEFAYTYFEIST